jgi:pantetheine-phosphate adenylyltransferase
MRRALFAGSFDPPTLGHLDIIQRAALLFDELIVAVAVNPVKNSSKSFPLPEREKMLRELVKDLKNVKVENFSELAVDFATKMKVDCLVRGLRPCEKMDEEFQMAGANRKLSGIETLFLVADPQFAHISSSLIREIAHFKGSLKEFVPASIEQQVSTFLKS